MKKLILCFDGTGNEPKDADQDNTWFGFGEPEDNSISNVLKMHLLLGGNLQGGHAIGDQLSFYYSGVGTYGNLFEKLKNSFNAPPEKDVGKIIKMGMCDLYRHYEPGDQVYIFGFSRGAAIARRFASVLKDTCEAFDWDSPPKITFMGVFDTVAAMNKPNLSKKEIKPASDVVFENGTISPLIEKALHLLSIDERRIAFMPTLMNRDEKRVTEIWFSGAHSDVGGGYYYDGLSDNALQFMIEYIQSDSDLTLKFLSAGSIDFLNLFEGGKDLIQYEDVVLLPNLMGKNHEQSAITKIKDHFLDHRSPRINVNDKHSVYPPIIHRSVFDRMVADADYNPKALSSYLKNPYTGENVSIRVWEYDHRCTEYAIPQDAKNASNTLARTLDVNESATFTVSSNIKYNRTGVYVGNNSNEAYSFTVDMNQKWFDASIECNPKGWDRDNDSLTFLKRQFIHLMEGERRCPDANWFELIGTIGQNDQHIFQILNYTNKEKTYAASAKGELFAYANDLLSKYGNNRGSIMVSIKRVK